MSKLNRERGMQLTPTPYSCSVEHAPLFPPAYSYTLHFFFPVLILRFINSYQTSPTKDHLPEGSLQVLWNPMKELRLMAGTIWPQEDLPFTLIIRSAHTGLTKNLGYVWDISAATSISSFQYFTTDWEDSNSVCFGVWESILISYFGSQFL